MSMDFKRGGQAIQRIRKERGMTQEDLADKSGITSNTVSRIERGLLIPALPTLIDIDFCLQDSCSLDKVKRHSTTTVLCLFDK